jgi:hypothetical protein
MRAYRRMQAFKFGRSVNMLCYCKNDETIVNYSEDHICIYIFIYTVFKTQFLTLTFPSLLKTLLLANKFLQGLYSNTLKRNWLLARTSYVLTKLPLTYQC